MADAAAAPIPPRPRMMESYFMAISPKYGRGRSASLLFFFSSRRRHTRFSRDWSSDVCSSDLLDVQTLRIMRSVIVELCETRLTLDEILAVVQIAIVRRNPEVAITLFGTRHLFARSEERRVGKEWSSRRSSQHD